jgi:uncharacterized membrane protein YeiH
MDASPQMRRMLFALDVGGTFVFGVEGALAAIGGHLDLLGVFVLAFATALGGGVIRDVLIGALPPAALSDWRYTIVVLAAAGAGVAEYFVAGHSGPTLLAYLDAAGLALFAIAGTEKALAYHVHPLIAILLGGISGVGGGIIRDVFLTRVPHVLDTDFYASAALIGAASLVLARTLRIPPAAAALAGITICFGLRVVAMTQHWHLDVISP